MRCPSCGTDNEPDSRFCGGCGARLAGESRLAPTQKIDTGAQPVQQPPPSQVQEVRIPSSRPPDSRPPRQIGGSGNVPPASYPLTPSVQRPPDSRPPRSESKPQPAQAPLHTPAPGSRFGASNGASPPGTSQQPRASAPPTGASASIVAPKRRTGLIFAVLLVDLALAGAGAYLLIEGLASSGEPTAAETGSPGSATPTSAGSSASKTEVTTAQPAALASSTPPDAAPVDAAISVTPIPVDAMEVAAPPPDAAAVKKPAARKKTTDRKKTTQPVDPYDDPGAGPSDPFPPDLPPPPPPPPDP